MAIECFSAFSDAREENLYMAAQLYKCWDSTCV